PEVREALQAHLPAPNGLPALLRARLHGHLDKLLPKRQKLTRGHHAAMPYADVPAFVASLRGRQAIAAMALEFLIWTTVLPVEVFGARWSEIDFDQRTWTVPASRMKATKEHRVPLPDRALAILKELSRTKTSEVIFPGQHVSPPDNKRVPSGENA